MTVRGIAAAIAGLVVLACGAPPDPAVTASDSAGVRVVRVNWDQAPIGTIDATPLFVIGDQPGDADLEFHGVRGVAVLNDSVLLVIDGGAQEVARIDTRTRSVVRFGGRGGGPVEFRALARLFTTPSGTALGVDYARRRIVEVTEHGEFLQEMRLPQVGAASVIVLQTGPASLETLYLALMPGGPRQRDGSPYRGTGAVVRALDPADTLLTFRGPTSFASPDAAGAVIFGAATLFAGGDDGVWVGDTDGYMVELWNPQGVQTRVQWSTQADRAVTASRIAEFWSQIDERMPPDQRGALPQTRSALPFADSVPAFGSLLAGPRTVWIGSARPPEQLYLSEPVPSQEWLVVDHETGNAARIVTPAGFELRAVATSFIAGVYRDALGIESIRAHAYALPH